MTTDPTTTRATVTIEHRPFQHTAVIRGRMAASELPEWFRRVYDAVARHCAADGSRLAGPPFARYHHLAQRGDLDVEAGFPVAMPVVGHETVQPSHLPAGDVATLVHTGPYEGVAGAYDTLMCRLEQLGRTPCGPHWEEYLTGPEVEHDPSRWQTRLVVPLAAQGS